MTRKLILLRNGHYIKDSQTGQLSDIGIGQAKIVGSALSLVGVHPNAAYHSISNRARKTGEVLQRAYNAVSLKDFPLIAAEALPRESFNQPEQFLGNFDDRHNTIVVVTHQQIIRSALELLADQSPSPEYAEALVIESQADSWRSFGRGKLTRVLRPGQF